MTKNEEILLLALGDLLGADETFVQCDGQTYLKWNDPQRGLEAINQARTVFMYSIDNMVLKK